MWYFSWILGLPLAVAFAILNAMWLEMDEGVAAEEDAPGPGERRDGGSTY